MADCGPRAPERGKATTAANLTHRLSGYEPDCDLRLQDLGRPPSPAPRMEGPQLEGHGPKATQLAFLPSREITADRVMGEWVVRAPKGMRLALTACAQRPPRQFG